MKTLNLALMFILALGWFAPPAPAQEQSPGETIQPTPESQQTEVREGVELAERSAAKARSDALRDAIPQVEEGKLYPGETHTFHGVTMTWHFTDEDRATTGSVGRVSLTGPATTIDDIGELIEHERVIQAINSNAYASSRNSRRGYLDGILVSVVCGFNAESGKLERGTLEYAFKVEPSERPLTAAPARIERVPVSSFQAVHLGDWRFEVSQQPVTGPDGSVYRNLILSNEERQIEQSMPLISGAARTLDRFTIFVRDYQEATQVARLDIEAGFDPDVKGRGAYIDAFENELNENVEGFLKRMGDIYGFGVQFEPASVGQDESLELARGIRFQDSGARKGPGLVESVVRRFLSRSNEQRQSTIPMPMLAHEWVDDTHLRVWIENYDDILKWREEEEQRKLAEAEAAERQRKKGEERKRAMAEAIRVKRQKEAEQLEALNRRRKESEETKARFESEFQLQSRVYSLTNIDPTQIAPMLRPHLGTWVLHKDEEGYYRISSQDPSIFEVPLASIEKKIIEQVFPNDPTDALVVYARPATHEKIAEIIETVDGLSRATTTDSEPQAIPGIYRVKLVLLKGNKISARIEDQLTSTTIELRQGEQSRFRDAIVEILGTRVVDNESLADLSLVAYSDVFPRTNLLDLKNGDVRHHHDYQVTIEAITIREPRDRSSETRTIRESRERLSVRLSIEYVPPKKAGDELRTPSADRDVSDAEQDAPEARFAISDEDLEAFGFDTVSEIGRGMVTLAADPEATDGAKVTLGAGYQCEIVFQDRRDPYLIVRGRLLGGDGKALLLENTLYLEKAKPALLGLTNLDEALILVVERLD